MKTPLDRIAIASEKNGDIEEFIVSPKGCVHGRRMHNGRELWQHGVRALSMHTYVGIIEVRYTCNDGRVTRRFVRPQDILDACLICFEDEDWDE